MTEHNLNQLKNIIRLFYPNTGIKATVQSCTVVFEVEGTEIKCDVADSIFADLYQKLCDITGKNMPWGNLTGIRPTRLVRKHGFKEVTGKYFVSDKKIKLLENVIAAQQGYMTREEKLINYYVNIPVCPSRCNYCSFPSGIIDKCKDLLDEYVDCLCEEIKRDGKQIKAGGYEVYSIYVGGGTPTVLSAEQLEKVLKAVQETTNGLPLEFTCEAGRQDTITKEKLALLKKYGVTRVCVNPQSFNDVTLRTIGRNHTSYDFFKVYRLVEKYGFIINTDLIAGLADESAEDFKYSLDKTIELYPHNITVHTLSKKRGSLLVSAAAPVAHSTDTHIVIMVDLAYKKLTAAGYIPYYLYRQKSQKGALENVGYCKPGFQCINNISVMEETISVLASGAGAISKKINMNGDGSPIIRYANCKDISMYIAEFEERYKNKSTVFFDNV